MSDPGYVCWSREDALRVLSTEALEGNNVVFLATHHPIAGFEVGGSQAAIVDEHDERGLLGALQRRDNKHVFCVIEGEPGSGKSHLIRWLHINWPDEDQRDLNVLVQRADNSLEGTLEQLRARLPTPYQPIFEGIGPTRSVSDEGRVQDFLTKLANSMDQGYFADPPEDASWCESHALSSILMHKKVLALWSAPRRILRIIGGRGSESEQRDQELARFKLEDTVQIGEMSRSLRGVPYAATSWLRKLKKEGETLRPLLAERDEAELRERLGETYPESFALLDALQRRLNHAIMELLGTTARQLDELFKRLRRRLREEGRRLVLMLEDVTSFQGVDEKLIDALVVNADTQGRDDLCELISVLGVTPDYFKRYIRAKSNYFQRITQHVRLASGTFDEGEESSQAGFAVPFTARYLRAIRAGRERLEAFDGTGELFNRCLSCERKESCHRNFGAFEGIGLYPFTPTAVTQMFLSLEDDIGGMTQQTPRGLIQNVLNTTMQAPNKIERLHYPGPEIETKFLVTRSLEGGLRDLVRRQGGEHGERLHRLLSWWGVPDEVRDEAFDERGNPLFQMVPRGVFEAFGLPWLGDATAEVVEPTATRTTPEPTPRPGTGTKPREPEPEPETSTPTTAGRRARSKTKMRSKSSRFELSAAGLKRRRGQLDDWLEGKARLEDATFWNAFVHLLLQRELRWRQLGVSPWLQATLFTTSRVMLEGTKRGDNNFVIPKSAWVRDGLEAFATLQTRPLPKTNLEFHRYRLVKTVRKLEVLARRFIDTSLGRVEGREWSLALVAQLALTRAWLRGTLRPSQPLVEQWLYLFAEEPPPEATPNKRIDSWAELAGTTARLPMERQRRFANMVNLPQGVVLLQTHGECELGLADPSEVIAAMRDLLDTLGFRAHPPSASIKHDPFLSTATSMAERMAAIAQVPAREGRRLLEAATIIGDACGGSSIEEFARRTNEVITKLREVCPSAPPVPIDDWTVLYTKLGRRASFLAEDASKRVDAIDDFVVKCRGKTLEAFGSGTALLDWCIGAPADDLQDARTMVLQAERSLAALWRHTEAMLSTTGQSEGTATLGQLHESAAKLTRVCSTLLEAIGFEASDDPALEH